MDNLLALLFLLSTIFLVISIISLLIKFLFQAGLRYRTHFIGMGVSVGLMVYALIFAIALDESDDSDVSADQPNETSTENTDAEEESETESTRDGSEEKADEDQNKKNDDQAVEEPEFDGTDLITKEYSIEDIEHEVIQPGEGGNYGDNPIIKFSFDTTLKEDVTNKEITPNNAWISSFQVIQDNDPNAVNDLEIGILFDEDEDDSGHKEIKPGGTVSGSVSYELTDEETQVTLIAVNDRVFNEEIGNHDYSID